MLRKLSLLTLVLALGFSSACSKKDDDDHFLKEQQQSLEKAKAVEGMLLDNEKRKREQSEE